MLWTEIKKRMLAHPEQIIEDEHASFTYKDIIIQVENLAEKLCNKRYAVLCKSEIHTGIAILACFAANATAIPLSHHYGDKHCERILKLTVPHYIITDSEENLCIEAYDAVDSNAPDANCALIMCTSGTTGIPKGAMITEENLLSNLSDIDRYFDLRCSDKILIARPLYHCAVLTGEFLISLIKGTHICFYVAGFDPLSLMQKLEKGITVMCATPTLLSKLALVINRFNKNIPLRLLVSSGECMTQEKASAIRKSFPDTRIMNVYGLTEASPRVAYLPPELFDKHSEFVGYPLHSISAKIVDEEGIELPNSVDGELIIKGPSIMTGYYRSPETSSIAIRNGWLHTGDIACMDKEGRISIKCRKDNMIIFAGINIYPQEIENALCEEPKITEILAYGARDRSGRQHIVINVVASDLCKEDIFEICRSRLPAYEQPTIINMVEHLPRNASGKLLRPKGEEII